MKKRSKNIFTAVKMAAVPSNSFDLSHDVKMSFGMGTLVPHYLAEVVPGDKFKINTQTLLRFSPLVSPVMHRVEVTQHFYFVPNRIIWSGWEKWITREVEEAPPTVLTGSTVVPGTLGDYLGYLGIEGVLQCSALPIAAYVKVWDEYYRDQNLQDERFVPLVAGDNTVNYTDYLTGEPFRRAWEHDYFTSCLPFAQKGDAVQLPLTVADGQRVKLVDPLPDSPGVSQGLKYWDGTKWVDVDDSTQASTTYLAAKDGPVPLANSVQVGNNTEGFMPGLLDPRNSMEVDIQADATDINTLRRAFRLQEWLEKNARGGTRYVENILAHFGVRSSDARLNRPEYIGGSKSLMTISEVLSMAQTDSESGAVTTPLGQMAGHAISADGGNWLSYYAEEHGWIVGLVNVQPVTAYFQGLPKHLTRFDPLEYFWPSFANIGEQEVKNKEIFATGGTSDEETFGYIPRYSEYKYAPSRVHGEFKTTLAYWHLARKFDTLPTLSEEFIECTPRTDIFAVESETNQQILCHCFHTVVARRKMPRFGIPTI